MIAWNDSILVGIRAVDDDHKDILDHINVFIAETEQRRNTVQIHDAFRRMERCIYRHLEVEEQMLKALGYDQAADHAIKHARLGDDLDEIWDNMLSETDFQPDSAARKWLETWLFKHVKAEDFLYRDWIRDAGLLVRAEEEMLREASAG